MAEEKTVTITEWEYSEYMELKKNKKYNNLIRQYKDKFGWLIHDISINKDELSGEEVFEIILDDDCPARDWHEEVPISEAEEVIDLVYKEEIARRGMYHSYSSSSLDENIEKYIKALKALLEHEWIQGLLY